MSNHGTEVRFATKLAKSSVRILLLLFFCILAVATLQRYFSEKSAQQDTNLIIAAEEINGRILIADEKLTNAALAFAMSGNQDWRNAYNVQVPLIEAAINDAKKLANEKISARFDEETRIANDKLIKLETKSFDAATRRDFAQALNILKSEEYLVQKRILAEGSTRLAYSLRADLNAAADMGRYKSWGILAALLLVSCLIFGSIWRRMNVALTDAETSFLKAESKIRAELSEANATVMQQQKLSQLGQLTATVAHELRNPLSSVRTSAFLLHRKFANAQPGMIGPLERIQAGVIRCDNIITQLLDFSRQTAAQKSEIEFDSWMETTILEEAEALPASVKIHCTLGLGDSKVGLDKERFRRVIANLMSNASEALVGKGDQVNTLGKVDPVISIESKKTDRGVEVSVSDNGPGIPPDVLAKILEPLFTTKSFGTGLGLPAVKRILELHGGNLEVESIHGEGAKFTAWLPVSDRNLKEAA